MRKDGPSSVRWRAALRGKNTLARSARRAIVVIGLAVCGLGLPASATRQPSRPGVLVVLANYLTLEDLLWDTTFSESLARASLGLICPATARGRSPEALHASCAAGAPCGGTAAYTLALNAEEPFEGGTAAEAYARRTGQPWVEQGIVHCGMAAVAAVHRKMVAPPDPWALGDALRKAGIPRYAFGNADSEQHQVRFAAAMLTDAFGLVPFGDVGSGATFPDPAAAAGRTVAFERLTIPVLKALDEGGVVVLEAGDLERIERERGVMTDRAYSRARKAAIAKLSRWLAGIRAADPRAPIFLLSIIAPAAEDGVRDSPGLAVLWPSDERPALLQSNTTRTRGLITTLDVGPSILELAQASKPDSMRGFAATRSLEARPQVVLQRWLETIHLNERYQVPLLIGVGSFAAAAAALSVIFLASRRKTSVAGRLAVGALAVAAWIPPALLVPLDRPAYFYLIPPLLLGGFVLAERCKKNGRFIPLELPSGLLLAAVALSAVGLTDLVKRSVLSGWQMSGLRYYGIGNEFLGCALGAAVVIPLWRLAGAKDPDRHKTPLAIWFTVWALIIGLPFLGANSGGVIAAVATFGLAFRALTGRSVRLRDALASTVAGFFLAFALAVADALMFREAPSHMGQAIRYLASGDSAQILALVHRKLAMNLTLWVRPEARTALALFGLVVVLLTLNREKITSSIRVPGRLGQGILALAYGGMVAALVNDSGAVTLAFMACYALGWWLWDAVTTRTGGLPVMRVSDARTGR
ncbi:MAG: hypothetical protein KatS3mg024_0832 [Armatimonadota bacterium]|nr:MAG: hypothetical protein KatS3mg024_0832 [Armatimonadota bacterium]